MTNLVSVSIQDHILTIRLNRPEKRNALSSEMYEAIANALKRASSDTSVRAILLCGSGGSFCAGNDLNDFLQVPPEVATKVMARFFEAIISTPLPVVAAVDGVAVGIGVTMLLHCDLVYLSSRSKLSLPFANLGVVPEFASSMLLPRLVGYHKACELLFLGEPFTPDQALEMGFANGIFESSVIEAEALAIAKKLASKPRQAIAETKALMRRDPQPVFARIEAEGEVFTRLLGSSDAIEAMTAIMEKRKPNFS